MENMVTPYIIRKGDFIGIEYTAKIRDSGIVFDTTDEKTSKDNNIFDKNAAYGPVIICVGRQNVIAGLDVKIEGREVGKSYSFDLSPEEGFGRKNPKLVQLIATGKFHREKIAPVPGLQVSIDGLTGVVKTVSGGRTLVDFNHPLSGKELHYEVSIKSVLEDPKEKLQSLVSLAFGRKGFSVTLDGAKAGIEASQRLPQELEQRFIQEALTSIPEIKEIVFSNPEKAKSEEIKPSEPIEKP